MILTIGLNEAPMLSLSLYDVLWNSMMVMYLWLYIWCGHADKSLLREIHTDVAIQHQSGQAWHTMWYRLWCRWCCRGMYSLSNKCTLDCAGWQQQRWCLVSSRFKLLHDNSGGDSVPYCSIIHTLAISSFLMPIIMAVANTITNSSQNTTYQEKYSRPSVTVMLRFYAGLWYFPLPQMFECLYPSWM